MEYYVDIVEDGQTEPESHMGPMDFRRAQRVAEGASINLDHANWHIDIVNEHGQRVDDKGDVVPADRKKKKK